MAKKPEKGGDELDILKASLLAKDLDVITITDKMRRLEDRSQFIVGSMEKLSIGAREKITTLTDIIDFLTSEGNVKDTRIVELEESYAKCEQDRKDTITRMNKQMADLTSAHEFQLNSMKLKLEAAQLEEDLARRNHMYQQTTRILAYKLREANKLSGSTKKGAGQERKNAGQPKGTLNDNDQTAPATTQTEAIKFLYACLEDIELERIAKLPIESITVR